MYTWVTLAKGEATVFIATKHLSHAEQKVYWG